MIEWSSHLLAYKAVSGERHVRGAGAGTSCGIVWQAGWYPTMLT